MLLLMVVDTLNKHRVNYALIGGYAVALHGVVRGTVDVDIVLTLEEKNFILAERALKSIHFESRLPINAKEVFMFRKEYIEKRNLKAWSFYHKYKPMDAVDILITKDLKKIKTQKILIAGKNIKIATIQALIEMKTEAGRPQDIEDIRSLEFILGARRKK